MTKQEIQKRIEELKNQINELREAVKRVKNTCFSRCEEGDPYYIIDSVGYTRLTFENGSSINQTFYDVANYCSDEKLMKKRAAKEVLSRLIWREAEIANAGREDEGRYRYVIDYNASLKTVIYCQVPWHLESPGIAGFIHVDDVRACVKDVVIPFVKSCPELGWELEEQGEE